jgi:phage-related protein
MTRSAVLTSAASPVVLSKKRDASLFRTRYQRKPVAKMIHNEHQSVSSQLHKIEDGLGNPLRFGGPPCNRTMMPLLKRLLPMLPVKINGYASIPQRGNPWRLCEQVEERHCTIIPVQVCSTVMVYSPSSAGEKPLHWVGSSKRDFMGFPDQVRSDMGYALGVAQFGAKHPHAKPWKGEGKGVFEIVESHDGNAFRAIYTVRFEGVVYVLHAFQKKSPSGIRTASSDVALVKERVKQARKHYEANK